MDSQIQLKDFFDKSANEYTPYYCEENIYLICKKFEEFVQVTETKNMEAYAVILTNPTKTIFHQYQRLGHKKHNYIVIWDYHVIFLIKEKAEEKTSQTFVYDFDTILDYPCPFTEYFEKSVNFKKPKPTLFRVIESKDFLEFFASDRSHMIDEKTKQFLQPPPKFEAIVNKRGEKNNLHLFLDLSYESEGFGVVVKEEQFFELFTK